MKTHFMQYRYLYLISISGFIITGIIWYPYPFDWDSDYAFAQYSLEHFPPSNWMGWFYPYFWDFLYRITSLKGSIGVVTNLMYWVTLPIIYINLFPKRECTVFRCSYHYWYLALVLYPFAVGALYVVTNNILLLGFLLLSLAFVFLFIRQQKYFYLIMGFIILLCAVWLRKEAVVIVFPLVIGMSILWTKKNFIGTVLLYICFIGIYIGVDTLVTKDIPQYDQQENNTKTIDAIGMIALYDLTAISYYKNELLIPDSILIEKHQGSNRGLLLKQIRSIGIERLLYEWEPFQDEIGPVLKSGTVWHSALDLKTAFPIYLQNIPYYLWVKFVMFYAYLPYTILSLVASITALVVLCKKKYRNLFHQDQRLFALMMIGGSWCYTGMLMLSVVSVQSRYPVPATMMMWIASLYTFTTISQKYRFVIGFEEKLTKKEQQ